MFAILVLLLLIVAIINFMIKKKEHDDDMKMTKEEVKEERKSKEVAPEVKSAQRKKAMELLGGQGAVDVSTADGVVTNPTHYAVALRYEKGMDLAPVVVAKGENLLARRIKIIAAQHEVPMVENKPVASGSVCPWQSGASDSIRFVSGRCGDSCFGLQDQRLLFSSAQGPQAFGETCCRISYDRSLFQIQKIPRAFHRQFRLGLRGGPFWSGAPFDHSGTQGYFEHIACFQYRDIP